MDFTETKCMNILRSDSKKIKGLTIEKCKQACVKEKAFFCRSINYNTKTK